ncbi:MAG: UDP-2,3-diacylglucosamine diphosphatase LpxI [Rhodospirillales bacterium]|nr:UDP-2,3-diacylglucosamine diphosphatase LpxI [Rhodospirillales bacterium]
MSAAPEILKAPLGVIAGGGSVPARLLAVCARRGITPVVVALEGQTDPALVVGHAHIWTSLGKAGRGIAFLKEKGVRDLVMIGSVRRPALSELVPDWRTVKFFARIGLRGAGDDDLLRALREELEREGFILRGVHEFADDLLTRRGAYGVVTPGAQARADIRRGFTVAQALGRVDVGQSVIVQQGIVLGVEAAEGTDALILRCADLRRKNTGKDDGGVLVKVFKPGQDRDLDLPAIGPRTVDLAAQAGLSGIALEAGNSLILDPEDVTRRANEASLFVTGIDPFEDLGGD